MTLRPFVSAVQQVLKRAAQHSRHRQLAFVIYLALSFFEETEGAPYPPIVNETRLRFPQISQNLRV